MVELRKNKGGGDPVAQTFTLPSEFIDGAVITSVDLFFATAGDTLPVFVQIADTENGYPSTNLVQHGIAAINASQIKTSTDSSVATRCYFINPVYLKPNVNYALKVLSNSVVYQVWVAQMGAQRVDKPIYVTQQPSTGAFFESQNNSAWTANQLLSLKYRINHASFDISKSGTVPLTNAPLAQSILLTPNPFTVITGQTTVLVNHPNHGMFSGQLVTYSGSTYTAMNTTFQIVSVVDVDRYTVTATSASATDTVGGSAVFCSKSIKFDTFNIQSATFLPTTCGVDYTAKLTSQTGLDSIFTAYSAGSFQPLTTPKYVYSVANENTFIGGAKSLQVNLDIFSSDSTVSPLIQSDSLAMALKSYRIDARTTDPTISSMTAVVTTTGSAGGLGVSTFTVASSSSIVIGQYAVGTGLAVNSIVTGISGTTITVSQPGTGTVSGTVSFYPALAPVVTEDIATGNSLKSRYISIPVTLDSTASLLQFMFSANVPYTSSIQLWYRSTIASANNDISRLSWVQVPMTLQNSTTSAMTDYKFNVAPVASFTEFQSKIVFTSTNSTQVPTVTSFVAIALA